MKTKCLQSPLKNFSKNGLKFQTDERKLANLVLIEISRILWSFILFYFLLSICEVQNQTIGCINKFINKIKKS